MCVCLFPKEKNKSAKTSAESVSARLFVRVSWWLCDKIKDEWERVGCLVRNTDVECRGFQEKR